METLYVACHLGAESGRIALGNLNDGKLRLSDIRRFSNEPTKDGDDLHWDIPNLYQNLIDGLVDVGRSYETVNSIGCSSWGHDYMLFDSSGSLISPTFAQPTPSGRAGMDDVLAKVTCETIFDETGSQPAVQSTLFQLGAEKSRRLSKADRLLPVADGFNYLLSGEARVEASMASTTQLFNPFQRAWSKRLVGALRLPSRIFPPVVSSGTVLGPMRQDLAEKTKLEDVSIVSSCSHELASTIVGIPATTDVNWAFLKLGTWSFMGVELPQPVINATARELDFANEAGYGGTVRFLKQTAGLWMLEECLRAWAGSEKDLDASVMMHLASQSAPFESLINPMDLRFLTPGDMPLKVKEFCKETGQNVPRKPGAIIRTVLESTALYYRKTLREIESVTERRIERLYLLGDASNSLFNTFIANALQIPVVMIPEDITVIGNMMVQGIALKHIESLEQARQIVRDSFKFETLHPHAEIWNSAYQRLEKYTGSI